MLFTAPIAGTVYARHGTTIDTRLTVIDKRPPADAAAFPRAPGIAPDATTLLAWVMTSVSPPSTTVTDVGLQPDRCSSKAMAVWPIS